MHRGGDMRRAIIPAGVLVLAMGAGAGIAVNAAAPPPSRPPGLIHAAPDGPFKARPPAMPSFFGEIFPKLPGFTTPTPQQLADLAQTMLDDTAPAGDDANRPSGFTYEGQFIDHDLTLDQVPQPSVPIDPTTIQNARTFRFDLDSVYGGGPAASPQLYAADRKHFLVQEDNGNGVRDLPRAGDGSAVLVEGRNDENEIISQFHIAFLKFHNALIDQGMSFAQAQRSTINHYQWFVLHEFLPKIVGQQVVDDTLSNRVRRFYKPGNPNRPMTPVEFSVAAYRFGHSIVRKAYELNEDSGKIQVFSLDPAVPDLRGGRPLPAGRQISWGNFFTELTGPDDADGVNLGRLVDTKISASLFALPIPGAEATGSNVLAFRNMLRASFYGMPSGQDVAKAMGVPVISPATLNLGPGFERGTPLWYYILAESERAGGDVVGPVGARLIADVFVRLLEIDKDSILRNGFVPRPPLAPAVGQFKTSDFLVDAGVATRP